jgi:hypothetical protein
VTRTTFATIALTGAVAYPNVAPPSPIAPSDREPQQATSPVARSAQVWLNPAATSTASERPETSPGVDTGVVEVRPFPTCPTLFLPQQYTVDPLVSAQACVAPADTCTMFVKPTTSTNVVEGVTLAAPFPSSP